MGPSAPLRHELGGPGVVGSGARQRPAQPRCRQLVAQVTCRPILVAADLDSELYCQIGPAPIWADPEALE